MPALKLDDTLVTALKKWDPSTATPQVLLDKLGVKKPWQLLVTPLGQLPQEPQPEVAVPLLDKTASATTLAGGWEWEAKASATANITVDVLDADQLAQLKIQPGKDHIALSFGADLALSAGLQGQQGIGAWGQASAAFSAAAGARLHWYFGGATKELLIDTLARSTGFWRLPNDYDGLMELASAPDFWGVRLDLSGKLDAQLSAGAKAGWSGWTYGLDGQRADIGLSIGVDADVKVGMTATMALHVRPEQRGQTWGLKVELDVLDARSSGFGLTVGAAIDLSALAVSAERALRAAWPEIDPKLLDALTQPGKAIGDQLAALVLKEIPQKDLQQLVLAAFGATDLASAQTALVDRLTRPLSDLLDQALSDLLVGSAQAQAQAAPMLDQWTRRLLGDRKPGTALAAKLGKVVDGALAKAGTSLTAAVGKLETALKGKTGAALEPLLAPLGALGEKIGQALQNKLTVPKAIAGALDAYGKARQRLLAALSDAQKARIGLTLSEQIQRSRSSTLAVAGWFSPHGDQAAAQRLYHALCSGRIALLGELVGAAQAGHAFELDEGWLAATAKLVDTQSAVLSVFGADFGTSRVSLINMDFKSDLWGRLIAATAIADVDARTLNPWLERSVSLGVRASLRRADGVDRVEVALEGAFEARDDGGFGSRKWKGEAFVQHVVDDYATWTGTRAPRDVGDLLGAPLTMEAAKTFWRDLILTIPVRLNAAEWERFEGKPAQAVEQAFVRHGLTCLNSLYADKKGFRFTTPRAALLDRANHAAQVVKGSTDIERMAVLLRRFPTGHVDPRQIRMDTADAADLGYEPFVHEGLHNTNIQYAVFHRFAGVVRAGLALHGAAPRLRAALLGGGGPELPSAARDRALPVMEDIRKALEAVAVASDTQTGLGIGTFDEALTWALGTFVLAMADLTDRLPPGFLLLAKRPGEKAPVPLLIA